MKEKIRIEDYGIFVTLIITVLGINIFSYPRSVTKILNTEGWIATILAGIIAYYILVIIYKTVKINEFRGFNNLLESNFGKFLGKIIALIFAVYNIIFSAIGLRIFAEVIKMYLLEKTPTELIILLLILVGSSVVRGGISSIIKFNEVVFWCVVIPLGLSLLLTINNIDLTNVLPVFNNKPMQYIQGSLRSVFAFIGINIAYLIIPYAKNRDRLKKTFSKAIIFICICYIIVTIFSLGIFTKKEVQNLLWPTITMIKSIDIPEAFIERWDGVVMVFWILFFFTNFINMYFFSAEITGKAFNFLDVKLGSLIVTPLFYFIALIPENIAQVYEVKSMFLYKISSVLIIILPLIIYAVSKIRQRGEVRHES